MEEQGSVVVDVHGAQRYAENPVRPLELQTVELVLGGQRVRVEEVVLDPEGGVVEEVVHQQSVTEHVGGVGYRRVAVLVPDVHHDVRVQGVLLHLVARYRVLSHESVGRQVEDENRRWTGRFRSSRHVHFPRV